MPYLKYLKTDMNLANNQQSRRVLRWDESKTATGIHFQVFYALGDCGLARIEKIVRYTIRHYLTCIRF